MADKYDPKLEEEARSWMGSVLQEAFPEGDLHDILKSGVVLCRVANAIKPGSVAKVNESSMAFKQMENINKFLEFCYALEVPKSDLFQTIDLFENQNMMQVITGVHALARHAAAKGLCSGVGPKLADANPRQFTEEQLNAGASIPSLQMGTNQGANQSGMSYGRRRDIESHVV